MNDIWSLFSRRTSSSGRTRKQPSRRLHLEQLEDRIAPAAHIGNQTFATIQAAVNAANTGAVITVDPGIYHESVVVNKSVTLEGAQHGVAGQASSRTGNPATESVVGNGNIVFDVTASNVIIDGFTIEGSADTAAGGYGVFIRSNVSGTHLVDNIIQSNIIGLGLANTGASQAVIQSNLFQYNNKPGVASGTAIFSNQVIAGGSLKNVLIKGNTFVANHNAGIELASSDPTKGASNIAILGNTFNFNAQDVYLDNTTNATIMGNSILNTISPAIGGAGSAAIGLFGNDNNIAIAHNLIQNGTAFGIRIGAFITGPNSNIAINDNSLSGFVSAALHLDVGGYSGILNAVGNYWGAATGPTSPNNPGGTGGGLDDPGQQVIFAPWLSSGVNNVPSGQPGFLGDPGSLISSNPLPPSGNSSPSSSPATVTELFQLIISDLMMALQLQSSGLDQAQKMLGAWLFRASSQSPTDATNLVFDEIALTTGAISALQGAFQGKPDSALLEKLGQLEETIAENPLASTQAGQQIIALTGPLVLAELQVG